MKPTGFMLSFVFLTAVSAAAQNYTVSTGNLELHLNSAGEVTSAIAGPERVEYQMQSTAGLGGSADLTSSSVRELPTGAVEFTYDLGSSGTLTSTFQPADDSIHWQVKVVGAAGVQPYSTPIEASLALGAKTDPLFWAPWSAGQGLHKIKPDFAPTFKNLNESDMLLRSYWVDPLVPQPLGNDIFEVGSFFRRGGGISVPLAMFVDRSANLGISLVQSPADTLLYMECQTSPDQRVIFSHENHRIVQSNPIEFNMNIVVHEPDPRAGLAWMVKTYPEYFEPPNPRAHEIAGGGAYSEYEAPWDAEKLKQMAFRVNWKVSVDFPYMGMFLPPVEPHVQWDRYAGGARGRWAPGDEGRFGKISIEKLADYSRQMVADGFNVLSYFNVTEFGDKIVYPPTPGIKETTGPLWMDANAFLNTHFPDAILHAPGVRESWGGSVAMDSAEPGYQEFLVKQAQRHIDEIPDAAGLCVDRLDWLNQYNRTADDGVSWYYGGPARSIGMSWKDTSAKLGELLHKADKVLFVNNIYNRLDLLRHVDGFYQEKGNRMVALNGGAFVALRKPQMIWTQRVDLEVNGPDTFFQRALYMGAHVTVPIPGNDHTITPDPWVDAEYIRYGKLFDAIHQRKWVLKPNPVSVEASTSSTKANVFEVPDGLVVPVVFAGYATHAKVTLRHLDGKPYKNAVAYMPGDEQPVPVRLHQNGGTVTFRTPVKSGCAVVRLRE